MGTENWELGTRNWELGTAWWWGGGKGSQFEAFITDQVISEIGRASGRERV
mgnify:CR=1 FL=1